MRQALAYIRVSTDEQGESRFGYDLQRTQIKTYAKEIGCRIVKFYSDVGTGMGSDAHIRRDRALAVARALRSSWPVIVASLDRFARDADTIEDKVIQGSLVVISAQNGEHATGAEIRAQAARDQRGGELISSRTKDAFKSRKGTGVLGNKNIMKIQQKAVETNQRNAALRSGEFERALAEVRSSGAKTTKQVAAAFFERGFLPARGDRWTPGNVDRAIGKLRARQRSDAIKTAMSTMFTADGKFTSVGAERWRKAALAKGTPPEKIEKAMARLESKLLNREGARKLAEWVVAAEAMRPPANRTEEAQ